MIDKIVKLLAKAERASTPEEADAYFAAAQRLASTHSIDLAKARQAVAHQGKVERPQRRMLAMPDFGRNTKKHLVRLYLNIGWANDVKIDIARDNMTIYSYGFPSDIDVVDSMFAVLAPQMVKDAEDFIRSGKHKSMNSDRYTVRDGEVVFLPLDGRVARSEFYNGFVERIWKRLNGARTEAIAEAESNGTGTELVLADKSREIRDFHKMTSQAKGRWKGSTTTGYSAESQAAGQEAGQRARMSGGQALANRQAVSA